MARRNLLLRDRHQGQRCFILGNGGSLARQDLSPLRNELVFVCNFFNLHPQCRTVSPRYYGVFDSRAFYPEEFPVERRTLTTEWFADVTEKVPNLEWILPMMAHTPGLRHGWFKNQPAWFVPERFRGAGEERFYETACDLTDAVPYAFGIIPDLLMRAAIYMGCTTIFLVGCDCDWLVRPLATAGARQEYSHFYVQNPFVRGETDVSDFSMERQVRWMADHLRAMRLVGSLADRRGVRIFNATDGGLLDCFPRIAFETIFRQDDERQAPPSTGSGEAGSASSTGGRWASSG